MPNGEYLQTAAGEPELTLNGLVWIGDTTERDHLWLPSRGRECGTKQSWCLFLDQNLALEIETCRKPQPLVMRLLTEDLLTSSFATK
jgi:hypothetical protein